MSKKTLDEFAELWADENWVLLREPDGGFAIVHRGGAIELIEDEEVHRAVCDELLRLGREIISEPPKADVQVRRK